MDEHWLTSGPRPGGIDLESKFLYGSRARPFEDSIFVSDRNNPEVAAYWATLTLKQKIVGSVCSIAVGAAGAGLLIALVQFLH
ncbi:hypothetical protein [Novosphingobium sp. UBA1939]|uniref:hypothetical protein n=1 Tax=Novosphingobium sp. UBA1939 TaxID=1946982 RepID=UPI0025E6FA42|nr:hypothetical protein [Novosphingobium sp. UBA1939]